MKANSVLRGVAFSSFLIFASGCAAMRAESARQNSLRAQLQTVVYPQAAETTLDEARGLVQASGYPAGENLLKSLANYAAGQILGQPNLNFRSGTRPYSSDSAQRDRYFVEAIPEPNGSRAIFTHQILSRDAQGKEERITEERDYRMELELLRRISPEQAHAIEAEADRQARLANAGS